MEPFEATRIVYSRVQSLDPENVSKIMGYLLLQDNGEQEILKLAIGSELLLHSVVVKVKRELGLRGGLHLPTELSLLQSSPQLNNGGEFCRQISNYVPAQLLQQSPQLPQLSLQLPQFSSQLPQHFLRLPQHSSQLPQHSLQLPQHSPQLQQVSIQLPQHSRQLTQHFPHLPQHSPRYTSQSLNQLSSPHFHSCMQQTQEPHPLNQIHTDHFPWRGAQSYSTHDAMSLHEQLPLNARLKEKQAQPAELAFKDFAQSMSSATVSGFLTNSRVAGERPIEQPLLDDLPSQQPLSLAWKPCLYFSRGYCKHGFNCRFLHSQSRDNSESWEMNAGEEGIGAVGSLERLGLELQELLQARGAPIPIASLPQLYYQRFGKTFQGEGYLTESLRHGKAGHSLTKLIARLSSTVSLIDGAHGQHAIVLAEDAHKFTLCQSNGDEFRGVSSSSRQIYLTFPAESTLTEEGVSTHFSAYGPVQDVRIPYQQKRMFGFVTFAYSETVKTILSEGNPHYICGARVLVKPYREKWKHGDKKLFERGELPRYSPCQSMSAKNYDTSASKISHENHKLLAQMDEEAVLELERKWLMEMHVADMRRQRRVAAEVAQLCPSEERNQSNSTNEVIPADEFTFSAEEIRHLRADGAFGFLFDVLDSENNNNIQKEDCSSRKERNGHMLPSSPFSSRINLGDAFTFGLPEKLDHLSLEEKPEIHSITISASGASNYVDHEFSDVETSGRQVHGLLTSHEGRDETNPESSPLNELGDRSS